MVLCETDTASSTYYIRRSTMYIGNIFSLSTLAIRNKGESAGKTDFRVWPAWKKRDDLLLAKDHRGNNLEIPVPWSKTGPYLLLNYTQHILGTESSGSFVLAGTIAERIVSYIRNCHGKRHTNCSTFVEYLRTGHFIECNDGHCIMFQGNMRRYMGQNIKPGDSLCILYFNKKAGGRTHRQGRWHYRRNRASENNDLKKLTGIDFVLSDKELISFYSCGFFKDYHFMFCIGIQNGHPIFIHQMGRNDPKKMKKQTGPIIVSVGTTNCYNEVLGCAFIKRE